MAQQILSTNTFTTAKWIVSATASDGSHTTIGAALTSASSGDTIFIRPGTYTENPTLKAGVNLAAYECDAYTPNVIISGTCTFTTAGTVSISGIRLQTNSAALLAVTGSAASIVNLNNCYINCSNNTGITFSSSSGSAAINIINCQGDIGTTGIALFSHSSNGTLNINYSRITNTGASSTANTLSAGFTNLRFAIFNNPFTTSGTATLFMNTVTIDTTSTNSTSLTHGSSTQADFNVGQFLSGSASALSISNGSTFSLEYVSVNSTNTNAITGAGTGTLLLGPITFLGSSSTINTPVVTSRISEEGTLNLNTALTVANGGTGRVTLTNHGVLVGAGTTAITQLSVGANSTVLQGSTGADPSFTATPTVTSITFGSGTALSNYAEGTYSPTMVGVVVGTTTYTVQTGFYTRVGNKVLVFAEVAGSAATGTGDINYGALPFTIKNQAGGSPVGTLDFVQARTWPAGRTSILVSGGINTTVLTATSAGSAVAGANVQMANVAFTDFYSISYQI